VGMGFEIELDYLLKHPLAKNVTSDANKETIERRSFSPKKIKIFSQGFSVLEDQPQYRFSNNRESEKMLPNIINNQVQKVTTGQLFEAQKLAFLKKRRIGVVFSGGPAPGGHNVIAGLYDEIKKYNKESQMFGFLMGPDGLIESRYKEITQDMVDTHRNMGGFFMLQTGRTKIDSKKKMDQSLETCRNLKLDGLVVIGGDDSNTNAAFLAQHFKESGINVIGVPKTIDGDIQVTSDRGDVLCAISFGFHSAARAFAQNISNLANDGGSIVKYWHVCKVMGRVASHLTLESALQTHANLSLIGEELADYVDQDRLEKARENKTIDYNAFGITLRHLSRLICDIIVRRAAFGKNYGIMIIPEGILEFINEIQVFIIKLNKIIADYNAIHDLDFHRALPGLTEKLDYLRRISQGMVDKTLFPIWNLRDDELFNQLPSFFREGLLVERDLHGNFQFSQIKTEKIILDMVKEYLGVLKEQGVYKIGIKNSVYKSIMTAGHMDPDLYEAAIFKNQGAQYLLVKKSIISQKTLKQALVHEGLMDEQADIPWPVVDIFKKSEPEFKCQTHFYGYDGRGSDPTYFDCNYTYNLGMTAFHLIVGNATGQMVAISNLELDFDQWEPIGIPIAKLMHLEERNGKLELVIEKSLVDLNSNAFRAYKALREMWVAADPGLDHFRHPGPVCCAGESEEDRPIILALNSIGMK
jgi:pyrophosphate--fructose-6-phosphate 1-phosphotransferase